MDGYKKNLDPFYVLLEHQQQLARMSELEWKLERVKEYAEGLFARAPWKDGDRARLIKTPEIDHGSGWYGSRHFLVKGRIGTVSCVDFRGGKFNCLWCPDDQTWESSLTKEFHPINPKDYGHFFFGESWLEKIDPTEKTDHGCCPLPPDQIIEGSG